MEARARRRIVEVSVASNIRVFGGIGVARRAWRGRMSVVVCVVGNVCAVVRRRGEGAARRPGGGGGRGKLWDRERARWRDAP